MRSVGIQVLVALALLTCVACSTTQPPPKVATPNKPLTPSTREQLNHAIAKKGNAATVGVYCKEGPLVSYYGTGAVISSDGYILTSTTVVPRDATDIRIHFTDRKRRNAKIVEVNKALESTLLKVDEVGLPYLPVADKMPQVGERAYSFGNARNMILLGEQASYSVGVISGIYHVTSADSQSTYEGMAIETDAAINPGQDGGPLLNAKGQLAGIISLSYSKRRWQGMAVPITKLEQGLKSWPKILTSSKPMIEAPATDTANGNPLAKAAREYSKSLVKINVNRAYKAEKMPRLSYPDLIRKNPDMETMPPLKRRRLAAEHTLAERTFEANQQIRRPDGACTGLLISSEGYVLTSLFNINLDFVFLHKKDGLKKVVYDSNIRKLTEVNPKDYRRTINRIKSIDVTLSDGRTVKAKVHGVHSPLGIAVLKLEGEHFKDALELTAWDKDPVLGSQVAVLGVQENPSSFTINTGIVSASERSRGQRFQFDACINYGNSGGPVIGANGAFLGIALHPIHPAPIVGRVIDQKQLQKWQIALNGGVSFGARSDQILAALPDLLKGKKIRAINGPRMGVAPARNSLMLDHVVIGKVLPNSPAAKAGMKAGDQIITVNGDPVKSWKQLIKVVTDRLAGDVLQVRVSRKTKDKKTVTKLLKVKLEGRK